MKKLDYFKAAMRSKLYTKNAWVTSAFSIIYEDHQEWLRDNYPYRLVITPIAHYYVDPNDGKNLVMISDSAPGQPLFKPTDPIDLAPGDIPNISGAVSTTIGSYFFNYVALAWPFGNRIPYLNGPVSIEDIEKKIALVMEDDPIPEDYVITKALVRGVPDPYIESLKQPGRIYVSDYLKYTAATDYLREFAQLFTYSGSERTMVAPPNNIELRNQLVEKYKDRLHDPVIITEIENELVKNFKKFIKGSDAEKYLITKKSVAIVSKKKFLDFGMEGGMDETQTSPFIGESLSEGLNLKHWPVFNNYQRAGSYNRGANTVLGGEAVKWLFRAASNIRILPGDCGSTIGIPQPLTKSNIEKFLGNTFILEDGTNVKLKNRTDAEQYMGRKLLRRSPMFCNYDRNDYCMVCMGDKLSINPEAMPLNIAEEGSTINTIFMKAMHGKVLETERLTIDCLV